MGQQINSSHDILACPFLTEIVRFYQHGANVLLPLLTGMLGPLNSINLPEFIRFPLSIAGAPYTSV